MQQELAMYIPSFINCTVIAGLTRNLLLIGGDRGIRRTDKNANNVVYFEKVL
jgi:hypothetical protein